MAKGTTRPYEVPVSFPPVPGTTEREKAIYLVDATSVDAARNFVAAKFVGDPKAANGRRVAELMSAPHNCKIETAKPETPPANDTPPGGA